MNKTVCFFLFFVFWAGYLQANNSIIEDLQINSNSSEGIIHIEGDSAVIALIGTPNRIDMDGNQSFMESFGFRIQVFMSNNSRTARSEALSKQTVIKSIFPSLSTYLIYVSPNWKLLVGDFLSKEEAVSFKEQLQKEFPEFGKEMYIVVDKIKFSVENNNE